MKRAALLVLLTGLAACSPSSPDEGASSDSDEEALSIKSMCDSTGMETFAGVDGTYVRKGAKRSDELERLVVSGAAPSADPRTARYERTLTRACSGVGCNVESGDMTLLADNAAFSNNFSFVLPGSTPANPHLDMYYVLGARRTGAAVDTLCVAHVISATDVRKPFLLVRSP
ncbi:MAG: hypothetical protein U0235_18170 [Polyangiaceae bacterium]